MSITAINTGPTKEDNGAAREDGAVRLEDSILVIDHYMCDRAPVVAAFGSTEPELWPSLLGSMLEVGAVAHRQAGSAAELDRLGREVERIEQSLEASAEAVQARLASEVERHLAGLTLSVEGLVGPDGSLSRLIDPSAPGGVAAGVAEAVRSAAASERAGLASLLDPRSSTSPLSLLGEHLREVSEGIAQVRIEVAAQRAGQSARDEEAEKGTAKGRLAEVGLLTALRQLSRLTGDSVEHVGDQPEVGGSKVGDILITLSGEEDARIVVEAKRGACGLAEMRRQLAQARHCRGALVGLGVYATESAMPTGLAPLAEVGPADFVVLYDPAVGDTQALQLAYRFARIVTLEALRREAGDAIDGPAIAADIAEARQRLSAILRLRGELTRLATGVTTGTEAIIASLSAKGGELVTILERAAGRLRDARSNEPPAPAA